MLAACWLLDTSMMDAAWMLAALSKAGHIDDGCCMEVVIWVCELGGC